MSLGPPYGSTSTERADASCSTRSLTMNCRGTPRRSGAWASDLPRSRSTPPRRRTDPRRRARSTRPRPSGIGTRATTSVGLRRRRLRRDPREGSRASALPREEPRARRWQQAPRVRRDAGVLRDERHPPHLYQRRGLRLRHQCRYRPTRRRRGHRGPTRGALDRPCVSVRTLFKTGRAWQPHAWEVRSFAAPCSGRIDVLVQVKEVGGVVATLELDEALVVD